MSSPLTLVDYHSLEARWITESWAQAANLYRVDNFSGAELVGGNPKKRDHAGLVIEYRVPVGITEARGAAGQVCYVRIRRDNPEKQRSSTGELREKNKYINAPGDRNHLYFPPHVSAAQLADVTLPVIITEGELKTLALRRLASFGMAPPNGTVPPIRFVPLGLGGVWNWTGKVGIVLNSDGSHSPETGPTPDFTYLNWTPRLVIIAFDAIDVRNNPKVKAARYRLTEYLMSLGCSVGYLEWEPEVNGKLAKGIDDWLVRDGPEAVLEAIAKVEYRDGTDWRSRLLRTETGKTKPLLENARIALSEANEWRGTLHHDQFLGRLVCNCRPWSMKDGIWRDEDSIQAACWLQVHGIEVGTDIAYNAALTAAHTTDCAIDWMNSLKWDGTPRLATWLPDYMSVATVHDGRDISDYVSAVGTAWIVGGVARLLDPGCQMDYSLVFCGAEGQGKSSALKILGHDWFTDSIKDIHDREALIELQGIWIVEFAELEAWRRAGDWKGLRAFLTSRDDKFRSKYGRFWESHPRRCVFAGTTNEDWFLEGGTEGRRFWPVRCTAPVLLEELARDVNQLWAEGKERWLAGARPYLTDPALTLMASQERDQYKQEDPWQEEIQRYCSNRADMEEQPLTVGEVLKSAINQDKPRMSRVDQARVIACLRTLKYEPCQFGPPRHRQRGWRPIEI